MNAYHQLTVDATLAGLSSSKTDGLSNEQIQARRAEYGFNDFEEEKGKSWILTFIKQFKSWLVIILLVAATISFFTGHVIDTIVILVVVLVNAFIGFIQEIRAERAIQSLRKMVLPQARVVRNGQTGIIPVRELLPGDIIILEEGDTIGADARVIESQSLRVNEASLTGESAPVDKSVEKLPEETGLSDRSNMIWKGTFVSSGFGVAVVCAIGNQTQLGQIAATLTTIKEKKTNFQVKTDSLAQQMALMAISGTVLLFLVGYFFSDFPLSELLMVCLAMMVAAIPEGLPAVLSIVLAIGSHRMSKRNAIIRDITSVETLGAVTTIITDKTGTLTQNTLTAKRVKVCGIDSISISGNGWFPVGNFYLNNQIIEPTVYPHLDKLLQIVAVSNNAAIKHNLEKDTYELIGDPTEGALLVMSKKAGFLTNNGRALPLKIDDFPFNSAHKFRASLCQVGGERELFVLGAPEKVLQLSGRVNLGTHVKKMERNDLHGFQSEINEWSKDALRVIGVAYKPILNHIEKIDQRELDELVFLGIIGIVDPLRPGVNEAVNKCKQAGIRVIMATGDHINTAIVLAKASGIIDPEETEPIALTEQQLEKLDDREFKNAIGNTHVFARLSPLMKLRIASSLQEEGELIAMTGDGVNDAPALKKADMGVSMGIKGTDVAREASKMVLADDNFTTIIKAIEEGRIVFNNARQTSFFLVTTNFAEVATIILLIVLGYPMPLTAIQILWLNLVTDGFGDLALATEKGHGDELTRKPLSRNEKILNRQVLPFLLIMSITMVILCISIYFWHFNDSIEKVRTAVFITMATTQLFNLFNMRSLRKSVFKIGLFSNRLVLLSFFLSLAIEVLLIELPLFQRIFDFVPLETGEFLLLILISSSVLWIGELYKLFVSSQTSLGRSDRPKPMGNPMVI